MRNNNPIEVPCLDADNKNADWIKKPKEEMSVATFLERYRNGDFDPLNKETQCEAGWYDWFCKDSSLVKRLKPMAEFLNKIKNTKRFYLPNNYVFFKNNCPMVGRLYDSFSICNIRTGDVVFWVGFLGEGVHGKPKRVEVSYVLNWTSKDKPTMVFKNAGDAVKWFNGEKVDYEMHQ